jgi:hypothetical protein
MENLQIKIHHHYTKHVIIILTDFNIVNQLQCTFTILFESSLYLTIKYITIYIHRVYNCFYMYNDH